MRKVTISAYLILFVSISTLAIYSALKESKSVRRDIPTLLNFYYIYQNKNPLKAKKALDLILKQDPTNIIAIHATANWYIQQGNTQNALFFLKNQYAQHPNDAYIGLELAKLYFMLNQEDKVRPILNQLLTSKSPEINKESSILYQGLNFRKTTPTIEASFIEPINSTANHDLPSQYSKLENLYQINSLVTDDPEAYVKQGYLELQQNNSYAALPYFLKAFNIKADPQVAAQIGYIYAEKKDLEQALYFFKYGATYGNEALKQQSLKALAFLEKKSEEIQTNKQPETSLSPEDKLWNIFYQNKLKQPAIALNAMNRLLKMHPNDIRTLKEAAYFAMAEKKSDLAIALWTKAYDLERNPEYALSIAYLYDADNNKAKAFHFFDLASNTEDIGIKTKAELAMTSMGGTQFKFLPNPFFAEFYSAPFYFSRFDLGVLPTISRAGVTINENHHTDAYASWRRTKDDRSGTIQGLIIQNSISQIFEDNVAIYAAGIRTNPWSKIPLQTFLEIGQAEDLVYRNRAKWRGDVRGGLVYYNSWGEKATWTAGLTFPWKWISTLYADTVYYSRYNNNIIGTAWFRPGFRLATFQSASLDLYMANYLILDKNHEFYNNIYSLGPGIAFQPSNRINAILRLESLQAFYIPVNSPTPNPYRSKYYNNIAMVEVFFRF